MSRPDDTDYNAPPWLIKLYKGLGNSPIQAQWKAIKLMRAWSGFWAGFSSTPNRFDNQVCGSCGAIQSRASKQCDRCGTLLFGQAGMALRRAGLKVPDWLSSSLFIGVLCILVYARMFFAAPGQGLASWDTRVLTAFGANSTDGILRNEWWRLSTSVFLHIGLIHLGSNLLALSQIGPAVEREFGRGWMLLSYVLLGIGASGASHLWAQTSGHPHISAGASGAIMGLIGMAAGLGHRQGTTSGIALRNQMIGWAGYTTVIGFMFHVDHAAHWGGFLLGALLGYFFSPLKKNAGKQSAAGIAAIVLILATIVPIMVPGIFSRGPAMATEHDLESIRRRACTFVAQGDMDSAADLLVEAGLKPALQIACPKEWEQSQQRILDQRIFDALGPTFPLSPSAAPSSRPRDL